MSPELAFILTLGLRMAITAAFVVTASVVTERSGPVIGALIATLPISAGPSYVFLALDHDAAFIAEGALASLPINAATIFLGLTYVVLAQRHGALLSCTVAVGVWFVLAAIVRSVQWSLAGGLIANAIAFGICVPLVRHSAAGLAGRNTGRNRRHHIELGRPQGERHDRAVPDRVHLDDADPASPHRRSADSRRARQQRVGTDRIGHRDSGAASGGTAVRFGGGAQPRTRDLHWLEPGAVVARAEEACTRLAASLLVTGCDETR
jgi:hypothetical protein